MNISSSTLVFLGFIGTILFIFITNPPHTICNSQLNELTNQSTPFFILDKNSQLAKLRRRSTPFFILDKSSKVQEKTEYKKSFEYCQSNNNPGACLKLFNGVKNLVSTLEVLPRDCLSLCRQKAFSDPLWETMEIMVRIGWGEQPPEDIYERSKWLSYSDFSLFCRIKRLLNLCHGEEKWKTRQEEILSSLPGADKMERRDVWKLALFATSCKRGL